MPHNMSAWLDICIHIVVIAILVMMLATYNMYIGVIGAVVLLSMAFFAKERCTDRQKKFEAYCNDVIKNVNELSNYAVDSLSQIMLIIDADGRILWTNKYAQSELEKYWGTRPDVGINIRDYWPEVVLEPVWGTEGEYVFFDKEKFFQARYKPINTKDDEKSLMVLYIANVTETEQLKIKCQQSQTVLGYIQIDNYDEVLQGLAEAERTTLLFEVNRLLSEWVLDLGGFLRRVGTDIYVVLMDRKGLDKAIAEKFDILDKVRSMRSNDKMPVTLSIGIAVADNYSVGEMAMHVQAGLDLALGRGGDQVAVQIDGKTQFYGGKASAVEKHTRVKARVVAHALRELIESADEVFVMGHHNEDFDALGAAIGVAKMAREFSKPVNIVLSDMNEGIDKFTDMLIGKEEYSQLFVKAEDVDILTAQNPLLIVVDTHIPHLVACPQLLEKISRVVVIDHHRRSENAIANPLLLYIEPASSSTSELVTELLMYYSDNMTLARLEATALYAGILVDTKNFAVQTGVRTFDAVSYLRRSGADPVLVRQLFRMDYDTNMAISRAKATSERFDGGLIVASCPDKSPNIQVIAARVADSLLHIEEIRMSIVVFSLTEDTVGISARSAGELNVQVIMEQFGGGGHQNVAGAQVKGSTVEEVRQQVIEAAQKYIEENE